MSKRLLLKQVAALHELPQVDGHLIEVRTVGNILVIDAMHGRGFLRDVAAGIDAHDTRLLIAVGEHFQETYLHNTVVDDVHPRRLKVKKDYGTFKVEFHYVVEEGVSRSTSWA